MHTSYVSPSARAGLITTPGERLWVSSVIVSRPSLSFRGEGGSPCQPRTFGADAADGLVGSAMRDVDTAESWGRMRQWLFRLRHPETSREDCLATHARDAPRERACHDEPLGPRCCVLEPVQRRRSPSPAVERNATRNNHARGQRPVQASDGRRVSLLCGFPAETQAVVAPRAVPVSTRRGSTGSSSPSSPRRQRKEGSIKAGPSIVSISQLPRMGPSDCSTWAALARWGGGHRARLGRNATRDCVITDGGLRRCNATQKRAVFSGRNAGQGPAKRGASKNTLLWLSPRQAVGEPPASWLLPWRDGGGAPHASSHPHDLNGKSVLNDLKRGSPRPPANSDGRAPPPPLQGPGAPVNPLYPAEALSLGRHGGCRALDSMPAVEGLQFPTGWAPALKVYGKRPGPWNPVLVSTRPSGHFPSGETAVLAPNAASRRTSNSVPHHVLSFIASLAATPPSLHRLKCQPHGTLIVASQATKSNNSLFIAVQALERIVVGAVPSERGERGYRGGHDVRAGKLYDAAGP
ncbi:hypothetical protein ACCO45_006748 [Purpureocillium lilacinum]|uniref:Uncharacterized protein n=1 Tax=Purpureocillium lilacinum TaxID=33203 RepID=A0ACC4DT20_PURLI